MRHKGRVHDEARLELQVIQATGIEQYSVAGQPEIVLQAEATSFRDGTSHQWDMNCATDRAHRQIGSQDLAAICIIAPTRMRSW